MGRLSEAIADLEIACRLTPRRLAAWISLAQATGTPPDRMRQSAAPLLADAGGDLERALALMQGNRSSSAVTWNSRCIFFEGIDSAPFAAIQQRELARAWLLR